MLHAVKMSADAACSRISAGDDLAEDGQVRIHPEVLLGAAGADAESCDDFVEDQERAVSVRQFLDASDELLGNRPSAALRSDRFQIDRGSSAVQFMSLQFLLQVVQIAWEEFIRMVEDVARDASGLDACSRWS